MYVAPLNYDRFFRKVFSDVSIAKAFLEDFLDVKIEEITQLKEKHRVTDDATKELDFLGKNKLIYMFQKNIIKKKDNIAKYYRYYRWFDFAEKSKNKNNVEEDFTEYKRDKIFLEIIRKIGSKELSEEDYQYMRDYEAHMAELRRWEEDVFEQGEKVGLEKGEKLGLEKVAFNLF